MNDNRSMCVKTLVISFLLSRLRHVALLIVAVGFGFADRIATATIIQAVTTNGAFNGIPVSNSDLLQQGGVVTTPSGYTAFVSGPDSFGQPDPVLRNGSAAGNTTATSDWSNLVLEVSGADPQYTVTFDLDLTGAPLGYDITQIDTFSGWSDGRASQLHNIYLSVVGSAGFTQLLSGIGGGFGNSFGSAQSNVGLRTRITENAGNFVIASGVDAIRFEMRPGGAGGHVYREIDIFGVATVPEPDTFALGTLGLIGLSGLGWVRWRRRMRTRGSMGTYSLGSL